MREKKFSKRFLAWALVMMMTLSLLPVSVLAEDGEARFYCKNVTIMDDCDNILVSGAAVQSGDGQNDQSASIGTSEGGDQKDDSNQNTDDSTSGNGDAQSGDEENGQGTNGNGQSGDNDDQNSSDEKNEDEKCVAKIGEVKYETLKAAFTAAKSGDTIVLQKDIAESIEVRFKGELTLDLNKHSIDGGNTDRCIRSADNEELRPDKFTIKNGTLKNGKANGSTGGAILWYGNLTVENCWFENNQNCAIQVSKGENVVISDSIFKENKARDGAAIQIAGNTTCTISGSEFLNNIASNMGGAVYADHGMLNVADCTFKENSAAYGGAIASNETKVIIGANTKFLDNEATIMGGAVHIQDSVPKEKTTTSELNGPIAMTGNCAGYGGAISVTGSNAILKNSVTVTSNTATTDGGGIYASNFGSNKANITIETGNALYNNIAKTAGDDLFVYGDGNVVSIVDVKSMSGDKRLITDGEEITGWYYDGYKDAAWTSRWGADKDGEKYYDEYDAETASAQFGLKAAHAQMFTVTYTDGVDNEEVFKDQVYKVAKDSATPDFVGAPTRSGYTFMGWSPAVAKTVTADVTYTAQWKRIYRPNPPTPTVEIPDEDALGLNTDDHFAYIIGYPDGTVRPNGQITRAEATTIFFRLLTDESREQFWSTSNVYPDVKAGQWYNNAISTMTKAGIVDGYPDGTFRPDAPITRAEMAKIISLFAKLDKSESRFSDIAGHWAEAYIKLAAGNGWIEGYPDGTFGPQRNITRAETATMINRVLERVPSAESRLLSRDVMQIWPDSNPGDWFYLAMQEATNSHDYERNAKWAASDEQWTALRETRDWKALEK